MRHDIKPNALKRALHPTRPGSMPTTISKVGAIGLMAAAGMCATVPGIAAAAPLEVLNNGGFEAPLLTPQPFLSWTSVAYGLWAIGDPMFRSGPTEGISPHTGSWMAGIYATVGGSIDVYQIVDLTAYAGAIDAGQVRFDTAAWFNATGGARIGMAVLGYAAPPTGFSGYSLVIDSLQDFAIDGDVSTWQRFGFNGVAVPSGVRYLAFGINQLRGQASTYVDDTSMTLTVTSSVPELPVWTLLAGALGLLSLATRHARAARQD